MFDDIKIKFDMIWYECDIQMTFTFHDIAWPHLPICKNVIFMSMSNVRNFMKMISICRHPLSWNSNLYIFSHMCDINVIDYRTYFATTLLTFS